MGPQIIGRGDLHETAQHLHERPVGDGGHRVAAPEGDDRVSSGRLACDLGEKPRLPHARLAGDRNQVERTRLRTIEGAPQHLELTDAAHDAVIVGDERLGERPVQLRAESRRRRTPIKGGIAIEDPALQVGQLATRFEPEIPHEAAAKSVIRPDGLGAAAAPVQRDHELALRSLPKGLTIHEPLDLPDQGSMSAKRQMSVEEVLASAEGHLGKPPALRKADRIIEGQRRRLAPDQRESTFELTNGHPEVGDLAGGPTGGREVLEHHRVELAGQHHEPVVAAAVDDPVAPQQAPKAAHVHADGLRVLGRQCLSPHRLAQLLGGDTGARTHEESEQHRLERACVHGDPPALCSYLQRPEHGDRQGGRLLRAVRCPFRGRPSRQCLTFRPPFTKSAASPLPDISNGALRR